MVKRGGLPAGRSVTGLALNRDACSGVIWILGSGEVRGMAGVTIRWSSSEACGVALGADGCGMNAGQWEARSGMIEVRIQPVIGVVAHRAINRVLLGFVIFCSVVLNLVTSDTIGWGIQYRSLMARRALGNSGVSAR